MIFFSLQILSPGSLRQSDRVFCGGEPRESASSASAASSPSSLPSRRRRRHHQLQPIADPPPTPQSQPRPLPSPPSGGLDPTAFHWISCSRSRSTEQPEAADPGGALVPDGAEREQQRCYLLGLESGPGRGDGNDGPNGSGQEGSGIPKWYHHSGDIKPEQKQGRHCGRYVELKETKKSQLCLISLDLLMMLVYFFFQFVGEVP